MFTSAKRNQALLDEIAELRAAIHGLLRQRSDLEQDLGLLKNIAGLKGEVEDLKISKDRLTEEHDREQRTVKHFVGLEKKRQAFEIEQAKRETSTTLREENLAADKQRFEEHITFVSDRFSQETTYLRDILGQILDRLPTVTVDASPKRPRTTKE